MSRTFFGNILVPAVLLSGASVAFMSVAPAVSSTDSVTDSVEVTSKGTSLIGSLPISEMKTSAASYVGLASAGMLGLGISGLAVRGWRKSARKVSLMEQQLQTLQTNLEVRDRQLQQSLLSETHLLQSGLDFFLEDESTAVAPLAESPAIPVAEAAHGSSVQPSTPATVAPAQSFAVAKAEVDLTPIKVSPVSIHAAVSPLHAAQGFLSFSRVGYGASQMAAVESQALPVQQEVVVPQIQDLQLQLQQLVAQIEVLQSNLQPIEKPSAGKFEVAAMPESKAVSVMPQRSQTLDHTWVMQRAV